MDENDIPDEILERLINRPRGFLTDADREYLAGKKDFTDNANPAQAERQQRYRIRERMKNAIIDFKLAAELLGVTDQDQLFEGLMTGELTGDDLLLMEGYNSLLYLFWLQVGAGPGTSIALLRQRTLAALEDAMQWHMSGRDEFVEVDLDIKTTSYQELVERYNQGEDLTARQAAILYDENLIDSPDSA